MYEDTPSLYEMGVVFGSRLRAGKGGIHMGIYVKLIGAAVLALGALNFSGVLRGSEVSTPTVDTSSMQEVVNINERQAEAIRRVDEKLAEGDRIIAERRSANAARNAATAAWVDAPTSQGRTSTYTGADNAHIVGEVNRSMNNR